MIFGDKMYLSKSKIDCLMSCPLKFKYQYIDKIKTTNESPAFLGEGQDLHELFEKTYSEMRGKELTPENLKKTIKNLALTYKVEHRKIDLLNWYNFNVDLIKKTKFFPEMTEKFVASKEMQMRGIIDCVRENGNKVIMIDYKTGKDNGIAPHRFQHAIYKTLYEIMFPNKKKITHWSNWYSQTGNFYIEECKSISIKARLKKVAKAEKMVEEKVWETQEIKRGSLWACKYCPFFDICFKEAESGVNLEW